MPKKAKKVVLCRYCAKAIEKVRVPERIGGRVWRWATTSDSYYCPQAGGECWHEPQPESKETTEV